MADVFVNDSYKGKVENPLDFVKKFKEKRRKGKIDNSNSVYYNKHLDTVFIDNTPGKLRRPLIIVENGVSKLTKDAIVKLKKGEFAFKDLLKRGIIEYIDSAEEENCYVALSEDQINSEHTHLEVSPMLMFGISTGMVPFIEYGEGSRTMRGQKTQKQAVGVYSKNFLNSFQTDRNLAIYPQKPLVKTFVNDLFDFEGHSAGGNLVVAVMSYEGYNMEDGLIFNKSSLDRGLSRSVYFKLYNAAEIKYPGGLSDTITIPPKDVKGYLTEEDYKYLEDDGIIYVGQEVEERDILIGKVSPPRFLEEVEGFGQFFNLNVDSSIVVKENEKGIVSNIIIYENNLGDKTVNILLRETRVPTIGDKFASRYGQKGIIGAMFKQADMPFTENGIVPDLIFSPHSIPSRKTVSHIMEILAGKVASLRGEPVDGTAFDGEDEKDLRDELEGLGFNRDGTEVMYDPKTGKRMKAEIYIGSLYYLRLKYQVESKIQARATGPVQLLTRQPTEGRIRGGGLKLGEMEKDVMIAHGAAMLLKERFSSDQTHGLICRSCGYLADPYFFRYNNKCPFCSSNKLDSIEMAYAFKLLVNQLRTMGIKMNFEVKDRYAIDSDSEGKK